MSRKAQARILELMTATPGLSPEEVSAVTGYTPASVVHHIGELERRGRLRAPQAETPATNNPSTEAPAVPVKETESHVWVEPSPSPEVYTSGFLQVVEPPLATLDPQPAEAPLQASPVAENYARLVGAAIEAGEISPSLPDPEQVDPATFDIGIVQGTLPPTEPELATLDPHGGITVRDGYPTAVDLEAIRAAGPQGPVTITPHTEHLGDGVFADISSTPDGKKVFTPARELPIQADGLLQYATKSTSAAVLYEDMMRWPANDMKGWAAKAAVESGIPVEKLRLMEFNGRTLGQWAGLRAVSV